jgi:hypothetical protein
MIHTRRSLVVPFAAFTAVMLAGSVAPAVAAAPIAQAPIARVVPPDAGMYDNFGTSVDVSGMRVIVGAPGDADLGSNSGSAYVVDLSTGAVLHKLEGADTERNEYFGQDVGICGNRAIVGAFFDGYYNGGAKGAAYIFDVESGQQLRKLVSSDGHGWQCFGYSVDIDGERAIVGAHEQSNAQIGAGAAYVYDVESGRELCKLVAPDPTLVAHFGRHVALDGDIAVISAPGDGPVPVDGKVYVFDVSTGRMLYEIAPSPPFHFEFHARVAVGGDWVVVGEGRANGGGAVHVYDRASGRKLYRLQGGINGHWDFGTGVSVSQGRVFVGAPSALGRVYVYDAPTGELLFEQGPFDGGLGESFGTDLGTSGSRVAVGAQWDGPAGALYLFDVLGPIGTGYCGPSERNSTGRRASLSTSGSDLVICDRVELFVDGVPPLRTAGVWRSRQRGNVPLFGGGHGTLCLGGAIQRASPLARSSATGSIAFQVDLGAISIQPGEIWCFQSWYRDDDPSPTFNTSDAVGLRFH